MNDLSDQQLLREYAERRRESAFAELVRRHVDLVYSAALRMARDGHLAEDVTQGVFLALAGNAPRLAGHPVLSGWLHCTARNLAAKTVRSDARRRVREQEAAAMNELVATESNPPWEAVAPHLDAALGALNDVDRDALMLRYFEKKSAIEMAGILGISEEAAQKRVGRAVERLRRLFAQRGVAVGTVGLVAVVTAQAVQAAPAGLAMAISAVSLGGATATSASGAIITKTIVMTTLQKTIITTAVALAGAGIYEAHQAAKLHEQVQALQQAQAGLPDQMRQLQRERDAATNQLARMREENQRLGQNPNELLQLRGEVAVLRRTQAAPAAAMTASNSKKEADASFSQAPSAEAGREIGMAVVRGDAGAFEQLARLASSELALFNTNSIGLDDAAIGELHRQTFAGLYAAFRVIEQAAIQGNQTAVDAVIKALQVPELQGHALQAVGALAGNGDNSALDVLLNYDKYGFLLSSAVGALQPAAETGNQRAIEFLSSVTKDQKNEALWFMAASALAMPAQSGNATAIDALIGLSESADTSVRTPVVAGLKGAAANQNAKAAAALQAMGGQ